MTISTLKMCNKIIDVEDLERPEWQKVLDEMHHLMRVPKRKQSTFQHCTDRNSLIHRAEIESYKHWEYPWCIFGGAFEPDMSVLDCGCGRGFLQIYLALKGCKVVSVDISTMKTKAIRKLWALASELKLSINEDKASAMRNLTKRYKTMTDFHVANIADLPFEKERFDRVCCISVLEHMHPGEDEKAIREMSRVLKPGGRLLVTIDFSPTPIVHRTYNEEDIHRLVNISGLKLLGNHDYRCDNWKRHLNDLKRAFSKREVGWSSAGFILIKDK